MSATTASTISGLGSTGTPTTGLGTTSGTFGRVVATVKSAHDLLDKTWIGKADPYCVVKVADAEIQTHHVKNAGDHAVWDESFAFNNVSPDDVIEFSVYDHNRLMKDSLMGTGSLSMRQVFVEGKLDLRVPLTSHTGTKDAGEIWVSVRTEEGAGAMGAGAPMAETAGVAGITSGMAGTTLSEHERERTTTKTRAMGAETRGPGVVAAEGAGYPAATTATTAGYETRVPATAGVATTAATTGMAAGQAVQTGREAVCGQEYFTKIEDRPVVKERVTYLREHRPVEKEYVVETRATGVEQQLGREQEHMGAQDRVVSVAPPAPEERGEEYFTKVEDRPVMKERTTVLKHHVPVEREYVVETRATGVEQQLGREQEHMGAQDRVVSVAPPAPEERGEEYFTKVEDRPVVKERTTVLKHHVPVEKEYVVETRSTGVEREAVEGRVQEHMGTQDRIVSVAEPTNPCD